MKNVGNSSRGRSQGVPKVFRAPMYRAHCAVIFAIAQLSKVLCVNILFRLCVWCAARMSRPDSVHSDFGALQIIYLLTYLQQST